MSHDPLDELEKVNAGLREVERKVRNLEDVVWKHTRSNEEGLVGKVKRLERLGREEAVERTWWIRIIFALIALQTFLGPDAVTVFFKSFFGAS